MCMNAQSVHITHIYTHTLRQLHIWTSSSAWFYCTVLSLDGRSWQSHAHSACVYGCAWGRHLSSSWSWEPRQKWTLWRWSGWRWLGARPRFSGAETGWCEPLEQRGSRAPPSHSERRKYTWWWSAPVMRKRIMLDLEAKGIPSSFIHEREEKSGAMHSTCLWLHVSGRKDANIQEIVGVQSHQHSVCAEAGCYFSKEKVE